jgi:hypothetical protein
MLPAIRLDDQHPLDACEIREEGPDRMLAPELAAAYLAVARDGP